MVPPPAIFQVSDLLRGLLLPLLVTIAGVAFPPAPGTPIGLRLRRGMLIFAGWAILCAPTWAVKEAYERGALAAGLSAPMWRGTLAGVIALMPSALMLMFLRRALRLGALTADERSKTSRPF